MNRTLVTQVDSYKSGHFLQFPKNTGSYYYIESRGGADQVLFYGLQMILKKMFNKFPTKAEVKKAKLFWESHGVAFNYKGWLELVKLGYFPLEIRSVEEGRLVRTKSVQVTIESTDERFGWLPGWVETRLLQIW